MEGNTSTIGYCHIETLAEKFTRIINNPNATNTDWYNLGVEVGRSQVVQFTYTPGYYTGVDPYKITCDNAGSLASNIGTYTAIK